ncbi:MAG: neutral zinc metallopeptidase [Anaerolineae bacterium]|nr:neutral zinc metallopeptidase [Anaerolineae bacterium]
MKTAWIRKSGAVVVLAIAAMGLLIGNVHVAAAQGDVGACRYVNPDGSVSGEVYVSLDECAQAVLDETLRIGLSQGYGLFDDYALRTESNGDVYAASTSSVRSVNDLEWQYLGNLYSDQQAAPQKQAPTTTQSNQPPAETSQGAEPRGVVPTSLEQIFNIAAEDINDFWIEAFQQYGYQYTQPSIRLFDQSRISTGCGVAPREVGPFYCNVDHTMYYPLWFMDQQWRTYGDYAVVTIIAHEWGHSIQNLLGVLDNGDYTIQTELQADCFAGAYTNYANTRSTKIRLDQSDIEEGANALFHAGDPYGTEWWDPQAHGNGDQRYQAYSDGFTKGLSDC